jgi:Phosphotransferase enzyme family
VIVITSAAYVDSELQSEFGRLPPAFLPVGNRRLFLRQFAVLQARFPGEAIYLSLPESYAIPHRDVRALQAQAVQVLRVPDGLTLADSVLFSINTIGNYGEGLRILHGDTLIEDLPPAWDCLCVAESADDYDWHVDQGPDAGTRVWCGYFAFHSVGRLAKCLVAARGAFEKAVSAYDEACYLERVHTEKWSDFGHVNTFYRSRAQITTQRAFNDLAIGDRRVRKTGRPAEKIKAEAQWFGALPPRLRVYAPQLLDHGPVAPDGYGYELEYLCMAPLNELYVHGCNSTAFWSRVFKHLADWLAACQSAVTLSDSQRQVVAEDSRGMLAEKTRARMNAYADGCGLSVSAPTRLNGRALPSLSVILERCIEAAARVPLVPGVMHGDLCLSNILFDTRSDCIKVIDPRGLNFRGEARLVGDLRYDLAKLAHSVLGLYDYIVADAFDIDEGTGLDFQLRIHADEDAAAIQKLFAGLPLLNGMTARHVAPITVMLFLSMLPLHQDTPRRQRAMLANALRLYELMAHMEH